MSELLSKRSNKKVLRGKRLSDCSERGLNQRKSLKTNVFSGLCKTAPKVKSLKDLCIDKLIERLDKLSIVGHFDYQSIRPVLKKCSANQLKRLEDMNPLIVSTCDDLWRDLCDNEFHFTVDNNNNCYQNSVPNKTSSENWRQFYWRLIDNRNTKLNEITAQIKDKNHSSKGNQRLTKVLETEIKNPEIDLKKGRKGCPVQRKGGRSGPLMKKCLQIRNKKFML